MPPLSLSLPTAEFFVLGVEVLGWSTEMPKAMEKMAADLGVMADVLRRTQLENLIDASHRSN